MKLIGLYFNNILYSQCPTFNIYTHSFLLIH